MFDFPGFGTLLVHDTGSHLLFPAGIAPLLLEFPLDFLVLALALSTRSGWHVFLLFK
jgi:hypothetical protein